MSRVTRMKSGCAAEEEGVAAETTEAVAGDFRSTTFHACSRRERLRRGLTILQCLLYDF